MRKDNGKSKKTSSGGYSKQQYAYLEGIDNRRVMGPCSQPHCENKRCRKISGAAQSTWLGTSLSNRPGPQPHGPQGSDPEDQGDGHDQKIDRYKIGKPSGPYFVRVLWDNASPETFSIEGFKRRCHVMMGSTNAADAEEASRAKRKTIW